MDCHRETYMLGSFSLLLGAKRITSWVTDNTFHSSSSCFRLALKTSGWSLGHLICHISKFSCFGIVFFTVSILISRGCSSIPLVFFMSSLIYLATLKISCSIGGASVSSILGAAAPFLMSWIYSAHEYTISCFGLKNNSILPEKCFFKHFSLSCRIRLQQ